jgi:hypothetical protein
MTALPCNLRISEQAYSSLVEHAKAYGYIQGELTAKGVGRFLDALAVGNFTDTRPTDVQEAAAGVRIRKSIQLTTQINVAWIWSLEYPKQRYRVSLEPSSIGFYVALADAFKIAPYLSTLTRISTVFEAVGIGWLTPFTWPPIVEPRWRPSKGVDF